MRDSADSLFACCQKCGGVLVVEVFEGREPQGFSGLVCPGEEGCDGFLVQGVELGATGGCVRSLPSSRDLQEHCGSLQCLLQSTYRGGSPIVRWAPNRDSPRWRLPPCVFL